MGFGAEDEVTSGLLQVWTGAVCVSKQTPSLVDSSVQ